MRSKDYFKILVFIVGMSCSTAFCETRDPLLDFFDEVDLGRLTRTFAEPPTLACTADGITTTHQFKDGYVLQLDEDPYHGKYSCSGAVYGKKRDGSQDNSVVVTDLYNEKAGITEYGVCIKCDADGALVIVDC